MSGDRPRGEDPNLQNSLVILGYSSISLLVLTIVASIVVIIPLVLSFKRRSSNIVVVGTDSRLILRACRVPLLSPLEHERHVRRRFTIFENELIICPTIIHDAEGVEESDNLLEATGFKQQSASSRSNEDTLEAREKIARSKIRWGVLPMPPEWYEQHDYQLLGFGLESDKVTSPVQGRWYK